MGRTETKGGRNVDEALAGDVIELRGLRVLGTIGALPEEQGRAQPFEIDLDVHADLGPSGQSDVLADTLDYGRLVAAAHDVVATERHQLLERVAQRIADAVLAVDRRALAVRVTVRKLRPPVPYDLDTRGGHHHPDPRPLTRAFLGLGSNLGDRAAYLDAAVGALPDRVAVSPVYETAPVGGPGGQGRYLNLVVELDTDRSPRQLLALCHELETAAARVRTERWGPRTLDVDVLWVDGVDVDEPDLIVPHPRMRERAFVLAPLRDLAPDLVPADWAENVDAEGIERRGALADVVAAERG